MAARGQHQHGWADVEDTLQRLANTGLTTAQNAMWHAMDWCNQLVDQLVPLPASRLSYIFRPGSADMYTLGLVAFVLIWCRVSFLATIVHIAIAVHVGKTWIGHKVNAERLNAYKALGAPKEALQRQIQTQEEAVQQALQGNAKLQASVAALELQAQQATQLQAKHDQLLAQVSRMEELQRSIEVSQRKLTRLPHLHTQLRSLQWKRRTLERIKWAVQVLKAETAKADVYEQQYEQLKDTRAQMQATKQALLQLQQEANQVQALEATRDALLAGAAQARQLHAQVKSLQQGRAGVGSTGGQPTASTTTSSPAKHTSAGLLPPMKTQSPRTTKLLSTADQQGGARGVPCRSSDSSMSSSSRRVPQHTGISYGSCRDAPSFLVEGSDASDARQPADQCTEGASSKVARKQVLTSAGQSKLPSMKPGAGRPQDKAAAVGQLPDLDTVSVGSTATSKGPASSVRHSVLLGTPEGGSNLFWHVVDNEAYYTPIMNPTADGDQLDLGNFTPGPEAAALAAALNAGSLAVPRKTLSLNSTAVSGVVGSAGGVMMVHPDYADDACFPPTVHTAAGGGVGGGEVVVEAPAGSMKPAGSAMSGGQSVSLM